jgi:NifB/MoaA-like Fe-S oxidoreductase
MIRVTAVQPDSIARELGLREGTELLSVNGRELEDFLDWEFLTAEERFLLHVRQPDGEEIEFDIERGLADPLGVSLEPARIRRCANRCDFCFVDGLPDGLRDVLYIRDDDYRLSFRYGNFATLTNLKQKDVDRIIVPAVAAVRLGARHRPRRPPLPAPQSDRARDHPAAAAVRGPRHRVPHPGGALARRQRR